MEDQNVISLSLNVDEALLFGETKLLKNAFDDAKPKTTPTFEGGHEIELPEKPTHVRFISDENSILVSMPETGTIVLACDMLHQRVCSLYVWC